MDWVFVGGGVVFAMVVTLLLVWLSDAIDRRSRRRGMEESWGNLLKREVYYSSGEVFGGPYMDVDEFIRGGWLQEVNRLFFHPRGLALAVVVSNDVKSDVFEVQVWDCRNEVGGVFFGEGMIYEDKIDNVMQAFISNERTRMEKLGGSYVQRAT